MSAEAKKGFIISELKKNGCRITSQRKLLIDVILQDECSCCKEIYYKAAKRDPSIGMATVYRMVKTLEEAIRNGTVLRIGKRRFVRIETC